MDLYHLDKDFDALFYPDPSRIPGYKAAIEHPMCLQTLGRAPSLPRAQFLYPLHATPQAATLINCPARVQRDVQLPLPLHRHLCQLSPGQQL